MNEVFKRIGEIGIVPVIKLNDPGNAYPLAKAMIKGGIPVAEVTFRAAGAPKAITAMRDSFPNMLVGAGTVLTKDHAAEAIDAGASFIVAPGFNHEVVKYVCSRNVPVLPGVMTPTEIETALNEGLDTVKVFPAEAAGGIEMIKAMAAPYSNVRFVPTGGINIDNIEKYLAYDRILACGGSWMVKESLIDSGQFDKITELCREAVQIRERIWK